MNIYFLGVGEACDAQQGNTSILLPMDEEWEGGQILLDCGFSVPLQYFSLEPDPEALKVLWISHFHGDHFLGTPLLLLWLWEMGRQNALQIAGPPGVSTKVSQALELAYPNLLPRLGFPLLFHDLGPAKPRNIEGTFWQTAYNEHSQPCLSLRLEILGKSIFYSGDGRPTSMTRSLAEGCSIIIHEAYGFENTTPGHGSIASCLDFTRNAGVNRIALVHMQKDIRPLSHETIDLLAKDYAEIKIMLPEKGTTIAI